jgi:integrase
MPHRRGIRWGRPGEAFGVVEDSGFKNASKDEPEKTVPLSQFGFEVLQGHPLRGVSGLVFRNSCGTFFSMRQFQHAYDSAFKRAGLPFRGTHVLRHGGASWVMDLANGDPHVAKQLLGNRDMKTVMHYAKRSKSALTDALNATWRASEEEDEEPLREGQM